MFWLHPTYLWALLIVPAAILLLVWASYKRRALLEAFADRGLVGRLVESVSERKRRWKAAVLVMALAMLALALAGPRFGGQQREVMQAGVDLVIALDASRSMLAEDVPPNRLMRARHEIHQLLNEMRGDRVGLVLFAGDAIIQCPITSDYSAFRMFLDIATPDAVPVQGTDFGAAIRKSLQAFEMAGTDEQPGDNRTRVLLLISDGEDHGQNTRAALNEAREQGIVVFAAGVGDPAGAPIPVYERNQVAGFRTDRDGNVVTTRLEEAALRSMVSGGEFIRLDRAGGTLLQLRPALLRLETTELAAQFIDDYHERYQFPLALALILLVGERLIADHRRKRAILTAND